MFPKSRGTITAPALSLSLLIELSVSASREKFLWFPTDNGKRYVAVVFLSLRAAEWHPLVANEFVRLLDSLLAASPDPSAQKEQIMFFNYLDAYHKSTDSGEC